MDIQYFIRGRTFDVGSPGLQDALSQIYQTSERPRCMCVSGGVEMYIAKHGEFVVKRMPETGHLHHPTCSSFEPELSTSGRGELMGDAIISHSPDQVEIRTDFPFSRVPGKPMPRGEPVADPAEIHAPRKRMSLRGLLHYLYEAAGFNRWYPAMFNRRNQYVIHKYLTEAARGIQVKGGSLEERLYVPEQFRVEKKDEIGERRRRKLSILMSPEDAVQFKMAIVIGEFIGSEPTPFGRKITVKHMPDVPLYIDSKAWERVEKAYGATLQARDADVERKPKALMAALIYAKREHLYQVDTLSLMMVTDQWVPLDGLYELPLIERLQAEGRTFLKPLKYDSKHAGAFPNVLLLDCGATPVPLHVVSAFAEPKERAAKEKALQGAGANAWSWRTDKAMPNLPARNVERARPPAQRMTEAPTAGPDANGQTEATQQQVQPTREASDPDAEHQAPQGQLL